MIEKDDHAKGVVFFIVLNMERHFEGPVDLLFVGQESFHGVVVQSVMKGGFVRFIHGGWGNEESVIVMDVGHVLLGEQF